LVSLLLTAPVIPFRVDLLSPGIRIGVTDPVPAHPQKDLEMGVVQQRPPAHVVVAGIVDDALLTPALSFEMDAPDDGRLLDARAAPVDGGHDPLVWVLRVLGQCRHVGSLP
jgi:hypothetical protein